MTNFHMSSLTYLRDKLGLLKVLCHNPTKTLLNEATIAWNYGKDVSGANSKHPCQIKVAWNEFCSNPSDMHNQTPHCTA